MTCLEHLRFRLAAPCDAHSVAALHADSWRRHYRSAYSDAFLDGDVTADRQAVWSDRLRTPDPRYHTILAEDNDRLVGFAHSVLDDDPTWGALLDNLHVVHGQKRRGIGSRLLAATAQVVIEHAKRPALYFMGPGTEHRRTGLLPGTRRHMRRSPASLGTRWRTGTAQRLAGRPALRLARSPRAARAPD